MTIQNTLSIGVAAPCDAEGARAADHLGRTTDMTNRRTPTPEALARIPMETIRNWPSGLIPPGTILAKHVLGCRTQGGIVSPSRCPHCSRHVASRYRSGLAHLDSRARGR